MKCKYFGMSVVASLSLGCLPSAQAQVAKEAKQQVVEYAADLLPMNSGVTGLKTIGKASFIIDGDVLKIHIKVSGAPANIEHWQHFHGFKDNRDAVCPTKAADSNRDGILDLIETESSAGTTMVPFNDDPVAMNIPANTYPKASAQGTFGYRETVSLKALTLAFTKAFNDKELALDRRVIFIHGVPPANSLPSSVASLGPIPAHVTLPIACGKIRRLTH